MTLLEKKLLIKEIKKGDDWKQKYGQEITEKLSLTKQLIEREAKLSSITADFVNATQIVSELQQKKYKKQKVLEKMKLMQ